jgi:hypothetical protein
MTRTTRIEVFVATRDGFRRLAAHNGLTIDAQLERLIRRERGRILGAQLSGEPLDDEMSVLNASARDVGRLSR